MSSNFDPLRVGLRQGERTLPAIPLRLGGNAAFLLCARVPPEDDDARLILDWACGATTDLEVRVRSVDSRARLAHLEIRSVEGDWRPWLAYLGENAA